MDRREGKANDFMSGSSYAQQGKIASYRDYDYSHLAYIDAEECYGTIVNSLRNIPGLDASGNSVSTGAEASVDRAKFVKQFMMGEMVRE